MIDNVLHTADVGNIAKYRDNQGNLIMGKLILVPIRSSKTGEIAKYQSENRNLRFTLKGDKLIVSNSLHKLHKGNNYSDFSFSELAKAIEIVEELTGIKAEQFEVKKLEFALNISTDKPPHKYLSMFSDFKGREYDKMRSRAFCYGIKYPFTEYALKIYDKSEMVKHTEGIHLNKNILRFEIQYFKSRKIPVIKTMADLKDKSKLKTLSQDFFKHIERVNCIGEEDFTDVSSRDREMYFAGQNEHFWKAEKTINRETNKKKKRRYRKIQNKVSKKNLINEFKEKLEQKFNRLIQS